MPFPEPPLNHVMGEDRRLQEQMRAEAHNRWQQMNMQANAPQPAAPSVLVQIEALSNQCSLLRDEVGSMIGALGAISRPEDTACTAERPVAGQPVSEVQLRLIELTRHVEESTLILRDLRRRIDL